jgi:hypothetical protein
MISLSVYWEIPQKGKLGKSATKRKGLRRPVMKSSYKVKYDAIVAFNDGNIDILSFLQKSAKGLFYKNPIQVMCMDVRRGTRGALAPLAGIGQTKMVCFFIYFFLGGGGKMVSFFLFFKQIVYSAPGKFFPLLEKSLQTLMALFVTKARQSNHLDVPRPLKILSELACEVYKPLASDIFKLTEKS